MQQPQRFGMMTSSFGPMIPGCPRGLETLAAADSIIIKRKSNWKTKYHIKTVTGQTILLGSQKNANCCDACCGETINHIHFSEPSQDREVLTVSWLVQCCSQQLEVSTEGTPMGSVTTEISWCSGGTSYDILGPGGEKRLQVNPPVNSCDCCSNIEYPVMAAGGEQVGSIIYKVDGNCCSSSLEFEVVFPPGLDVGSKATLLTVVPLIGAEYDQNNNSAAAAAAV